MVKFIDAVRRVELAVRLKKKQTKLKTKEEELIRIKQQEYDLLNGSKWTHFLLQSLYLILQSREVSFLHVIQSYFSKLVVARRVSVKKPKFSEEQLSHHFLRAYGVSEISLVRRR